MKRPTPRLLALLTFALLGNISQAAVSNVTLTNNGFVSPILPGYSLVEAFNFQGPSLTRNGISFLGEDMTDGVGGSSTLITLGTGGIRSSADIGSATDALFFTEVWNQGGSGLKLTISGLNPAKTYFFETYHGEPRTCCTPGIFSTDSFIDASGSTPIPTYQLGNGIIDSNPGDKWTISATITGVSTFDYNTPNGQGRGSSIMGYQLQTAVPEPTSAALLLAGGTLAVRRRRA